MIEQIHTTTFRAMGCGIQLWIAHEDKPFAHDCLERVHVLFDEYEARLTRFCPTSELSQLNDTDGLVPVSDLLWDVVTAAFTLSDDTAGLFDPTLLNALETAGYTHSFKEHTPARRDTIYRVPTGGRHHIDLDSTRKAIRLPDDIRLDLGGIGKGYTAQQAAVLLDLLGVSSFLIDAGGDLVAGGAPQTLPGWAVGVALPTEQAKQTKSEDVARLWLANRAMATSGVDYRRWCVDGVTKHHIIDPRTGDSADSDLITATILADELCTAEAWATAALVAGSREAYEMLCARGMAAVLITHDGDLLITPTFQNLAKVSSPSQGCAIDLRPI